MTTKDYWTNACYVCGHLKEEHQYEAEECEHEDCDCREFEAFPEEGA